MQDLWDEEYTDLCRENFINAMYKFPDTPVTELENGREMPILGIGTWLKQNVQETIEQALRAGFRSGPTPPAPNAVCSTQKATPGTSHCMVLSDSETMEL